MQIQLRIFILSPRSCILQIVSLRSLHSLLLLAFLLVFIHYTNHFNHLNKALSFHTLLSSKAHTYWPQPCPSPESRLLECSSPAEGAHSSPDLSQDPPSASEAALPTSTPSPTPTEPSLPRPKTTSNSSLPPEKPPPSELRTSHTHKPIALTDTPPSPAAWPHPAYSESAIQQINVARREIRNWPDWIAFNAVRILRWGTDLATGYRHEAELKKLEKNPNAERYQMTEKRWLVRIIFLESVAGVPGMVGGMLRHLRSLRRLERDNGWSVIPSIRTLMFIC